MTSIQSILSEQSSKNTGFKGNNRLIVGIVLGVLTYWLFAQSLVNIVPSVQQSVDIPSSSLNFAVSLAALFCGCFIVVGGGLADKLGRVKMTYLGFILSILGCVCLIFSTGTIVFSLGRALQGLSAALIMPATLSLMKTYYDGKDRQRALSYWSIGSWGGSGICSLAGGLVATYFNWKWIFVISIVLALLGMLLIRGTPESKANKQSTCGMDYIGLIFFVIALFSLNLVISKGSDFGWGSTAILADIAVFVLSALFFYWSEKKRQQCGFIDFSLFKNRSFTGATISNFMLNGVVGTLLVASLYTQQSRGFTSFQSGLLTIGYLVAVLLMIRVGEKLLQRIGAKKPMLWGSIVTALGIGMMALTFLPNKLYVAAVLIGYVLYGIGLGMYATPSTDTALANSPEEKAGVASGLYKMASSLGGAFGIAISASVYNAFKNSSGVLGEEAGLLVNVLFCVFSIIAIITLIPNAEGRSINKQEK